MLKKELRDKIVAQALDEIDFARDAKKNIIDKWHKNEDLYYSKKTKTEPGRANVNLNEAQGFVQSFLSKINTPYNFKYVKGEEADLKAASIANALKDQDAKVGKWNFKVMLARNQLILYGRYIFEYHASSGSGYKSVLSNVDVYDFLIDPNCGGSDIEKALYMGRCGIQKSKTDIEEGIKSGKYLRTEGRQLISGAGNLDTTTEEETQKKNRWSALLQKDRIMSRTDIWKFWEWYTTYEGQRYYVLLTEEGGIGIRVEPIEEIFESGLYPFFTAAAYPDLTEFWSPSPMDGVREIMMAKSKAINQMLDNGEAINRPMKAFDVDAIKNPNLLKYRTDGLIPVKGGVDINKAVQFFPTVGLTTTIQVYDKLNEITDINSGVTSGIKGQASEKQVGIYEGNQANAADRFSLISESESEAQQRFAKLYLCGLDEHLNTKTSIQMIGIDGIKFEEVNKKDLKRNKEFDIMVITSGAEEKMQTTEKKNKLTFLTSKAADQSGIYNKKILAEMEAKIAGFTEEETKYMLDVKNEGRADLMAECAEDIQSMLAGKYIEVNDMANTAYMQKMKDYLRDNKEYIVKHPKIADLFFEYMQRLTPVVITNMTAEADKQLVAQGLPSLSAEANGLGFTPADTNGSMAGGGMPSTTAVDQMTLANYGKK